MTTAVETFAGAYLNSKVPVIRPGDTVRLSQKIKEGDKERVQSFEGIVIAKKHGDGITGTITIRKIAAGVGVERVFPIHSPTIAKIEVLKHAKTRRAKLYYIREKATKETRKRMRHEIVRKDEEPVKEETAA